MGSLESIVLFFVAACFLAPVDVETKAVLKRRDTTYYCSKSTPCGWEVYKPFTRIVQYFIKSPCDCQAGTDCVRVSDDISIAAYVHQCRQHHPANAWPHSSSATDSDVF